MHRNKKIGMKEQIIANLDREQIDFLDKLGMDFLSSTGVRLSRTEIIDSLIDAAMALGVTAEGMSAKKEWVDKILRAKAEQKERRKFPRLNKRLNLKLRRMDSLEDYTSSYTKDISMGGFRIEVCFVGKPLTVNQVIEILINDPEEEMPPVRAICRVVWIREKKHEYSHEMGVMITYMRQEDRDRFKKYLS